MPMCIRCVSFQVRVCTCVCVGEQNSCSYFATGVNQRVWWFSLKTCVVCLCVRACVLESVRASVCLCVCVLQCVWVCVFALVGGQHSVSVQASSPIQQS